MKFVHTIDDLARDLQEIRREAKPKFANVVRETAKEGNEDAKRYARASSGTHARKYPGTFTAERTGPLAYEYGPNARGQGLLAPILENGSINNPPHLDLAKSADPLPNRMELRLGVVMSELFW
jgi:hypothetical protein